MCKLMRANPEKHGVSDSACLSQLQVIHKPCVLSQRGTGASSASSACQITVLGAVENLPDIGLLSVTHTHSTVTHSHTHYLPKMRIGSVAHLSQRDKSSSVSRDAVSELTVDRQSGWLELNSTVLLWLCSSRITAVPWVYNTSFLIGYSGSFTAATLHVFFKEWPISKSCNFSLQYPRSNYVYTVSVVTIDMWQQHWQ